MTFAPVKRTYNDRFFFSSEREEADLSNFELPQVFRASFSTILFLLLLSFRQKKGREFSRKSFGCSSIIIPNVSILLRSRMQKSSFSFETRGRLPVVIRPGENFLDELRACNVVRTNRETWKTNRKNNYRDDKLLSNEWSTSNGADLKKKREEGEKKRNFRSIEIGSSLPMKWTWRWIMRDGLRGPAFINTVQLVQLLSLSLLFVGYLQKKNPARFSNSGLNSISLNKLRPD